MKWLNIMEGVAHDSPYQRMCTNNKGTRGLVSLIICVFSTTSIPLLIVLLSKIIKVVDRACRMKQSASCEAKQ